MEKQTIVGDGLGMSLRDIEPGDLLRITCEGGSILSFDLTVSATGEVNARGKTALNPLILRLAAGEKIEVEILGSTGEEFVNNWMEGLDVDYLYVGEYLLLNFELEGLPYLVRYPHRITEISYS